MYEDSVINKAQRKTGVVENVGQKRSVILTPELELKIQKQWMERRFPEDNADQISVYNLH